MSRAARLALLALTGAVAFPEEPPTTGRLVEGMRCRTDPTQTYTLYLPTAYSRARVWPALLILDPRGRSALAAELFREAAEEYGWILLSSNDTRSDGPMEPNTRALQALWPEVHERFATDHRRIYAAGFSGGGNISWELGRRSGSLAGVIVSGARWEAPHFSQRIAFPCFGAAGDTDFNYAPMRKVHARLQEWNAPERLEIFEGPHGWMPASLARQAVEWLELQAMKRGLRSVDPGLISGLLARDLERARELEAAGRPLAAQRRYEAIAATFDGLAQVEETRREAARLAALPATRKAREQEKRWDRYEEFTLRRQVEAYQTLLRSDPPMTPGALALEVRLGELQRRAHAASYEGVVARRLLNTLATHTGFYVPRDLMARGDHLRAATALTVATQANPDRPDYWYNLGCALARTGSRRPALDALEKALAAGFADRAQMAADEDLASLRRDPRFQELVAGAESP